MAERPVALPPVSGHGENAMRQPTNQPVIFPKIDPIVCPECGGKAGLMRRTPDPENPLAEIRTFECVDCGNQTELKAE